ncbi:MAG: type II toxin-antitoxin system RelE/ParE family toxin [Candidatus Micrarchaeota archaeon]
MAFGFNLSPRLRETLNRSARKNPALVESVKKKIRQIAASDAETIGHFKNLRHDLSDFKRVHVGSFVLFFKVFEKENFILFDRLEHHDDAYKR